MKLIAERLSRQFAAGARYSPGFRSPSGGGEALLLLGPNGAGKTTLIRTVAGLLGACGGPIRHRGRRPERSVGEQCHYVGHLNALKSSLTVEENATFWCRFLGGRRRSASRLRSPPSGWPRCATSPPPTCRPGRSGGWGCPRAAGRASDLAARRADRRRSIARPRSMLAAAVDEHLAAGGLVVAATHRAARLAQCARAASRRHGRAPHERVLASWCAAISCSPGRRAAPSGWRSASTWWS